MAELHICPACDASWEAPSPVMHRQLKNIGCPECLKERVRRIDYIQQKKTAKLEALGKASTDRWDAMTPDEQKEYTKQTMIMLYGEQP